MISSTEMNFLNKIIEGLDKAGAWEHPWKLLKGGCGFPFNMETKQMYKGRNIYRMFATLFELDTDDTRFIGMKQANYNGWSIKKGSKATGGIYWQRKMIDKNNKYTDKEEDAVREFMIPCVFQVFHVSQLEGENIPPLYEKFDKIQHNTKCEALEKLIEKWFVKIEEKESNRAFFRTVEKSGVQSHKIVVPLREQFKELVQFYATCLHEMVHSTKIVLNRQLDYATEELVAEFTAALLCVKFNLVIEETMDNFKGEHSSYIKSWLKTANEKDKQETLKQVFQYMEKAIDLFDSILEKHNIKIETVEKVETKNEKVETEKVETEKEKEKVIKIKEKETEKVETKTLKPNPKVIKYTNLSDLIKKII